MLKGAIFDQDGLMFDTEAIFSRSWVAVGAQMGYDVPHAFCTAVSGSSGEGMKRIIRSFFPNMDAPEYMRRVYEYSYAEQEKHLPEKPGLHEILNFFRENGVKLALASSSHKDKIHANLKRANITDYFDVVISGQEVSRGKPDPEIFLTAAARLGLAPEECYVFEDSFNGVRAGHAAGCRTVMIPDLIQPDEEMERTYDDCSVSLLEALEKLEKGIL